MPSSGRASPRAQAASDARASSRARSRHRAVKPPTRWSTAAMRAASTSTSSTGESRRAANARKSASTLVYSRSLDVVALLLDARGRDRLPHALLDLQAPPVVGHVEVRREPHVGEGPDVLDQLVEHRDPRVSPDAERMHDEQKAAAGRVRAVELRLPDLEHLRRRGEAGHVREEAEEEVGRVVQLPAHGQLDEVAQWSTDDRNTRPVGLIVSEQARVVHEAELLQEIGSVRSERKRGRTIPTGSRVEGPFEPGDPPLHQLALLVDR